MSRRFRPIRQAWSATACLLIVIVAQTGCTSALTASYLRNGIWEHDEHAATVPDPAPDDDTTPAQTAAEPATTAVAVDPEADRERREAALEEAMARLSRLGTLTPAVESALVATLQRTQPEDWPVVVDEFAASLPAAAATPTPAPEPVTAAAADTPAADTATDGSPAGGADATVSVADPQPTPSEPIEPVAESPTPPPSLAVRSACFASAVRGWGEVERFTSDRFQPGQEVIVYVELENLAANESPAGHTTCIDAALTLVDDADRTLHAWTFDPVAETSAGRRHDYFARYIVRIPDSAPAGGCRIALAVTDTLAGQTATTTLPLEIAAAD